ncbi:MAG: FIST N-terminal domain-containing protein [Pseudomonadota bacterium]
MSLFSFAHSGGTNPDQVLSSCLGQLGQSLIHANTGFVYVTDAMADNLPRILDQLKNHTGVEQWVGATGVGICAIGQEYYDQPAMSVMLANFDEETFRVLPLQSDSVEPFLQSKSAWLQKDGFHFGVLHGDPMYARTTEIIEQLSEQVPGAFCVGALASTHDQNMIIEGQALGGGVSGLFFSSDVPVVTGHTQGCQPIADKHTVTACERNVLIELDDRPAFDVFKEDIGEVLAKDLQQVAGYIFAGLPVRGSDTGDYLVRNLAGIDVDQGLVAIGDWIEVGDEIMFCRRDGNSARADMQQMLDDIKTRLPGEPLGALYYSCLGRGRYQFGDNSEELKLVQDTLGDIPLVGFFANGEIFHNRLYGYTGVLTVFC